MKFKIGVAGIDFAYIPCDIAEIKDKLPQGGPQRFFVGRRSRLEVYRFKRDSLPELLRLRRGHTLTIC